MGFYFFNIWPTLLSFLAFGDHFIVYLIFFIFFKFSNQTGTPDASQQLLMALEERDQLGTQLAQVTFCLNMTTG